MGLAGREAGRRTDEVDAEYKAQVGHCRKSSVNAKVGDRQEQGAAGAAFRGGRRTSELQDGDAITECLQTAEGRGRGLLLLGTGCFDGTYSTASIQETRM